MLHHVVVGAVLFLSLGLDTLAVAIGLGLSGISGRSYLKAGLSFALAEGTMALLGFALGSVLTSALGRPASIAAALLLLGVGAFTILESIREGESRSAPNVSGWRLFLTALSVSLDELAIGLSLGTLGVPVLLAVAIIAVQTLALTLLGTAVGSYLGAAFEERAELASGIALSLVAVYLLVTALMAG